MTRGARARSAIGAPIPHLREESVDAAAESGPELADVLTGLSRQNSVYRRTIAVCDQLADTALTGVEPGELTQVFAGLVGKRIILMDPDFRAREHAGGDGQGPELDWDRTDPRVERLHRALRAQRRPMRVPPVPGSSLAHGCLVTPIVIGEETLGYLLVLEDGADAQPDDVDLLTATYAATLFALTLAHERTSTELGQRYLRTLVDALVSGHFVDAEDAREKSRSLGLNDPAGYRVCVLRCRSGQLAAGGAGLLTALLDAVPEAKTTVREFGVVAIVPAALTRGWPETWASMAMDPGVTCGLSEQLDRPEQAPAGLAQAEQALDLGLRLGRTGQLIDYHELGIYRLLLRIGDIGTLWRFADEVLGALLDYDTAHGGELVHTLSVYLRHQSSPKQTARELRVHANTVAYRAHRIETITGLDLTDPDDRLLGQVAVTILATRAGQGSAT